MRSDRFERLNDLVAEEKRKRERLDGRASGLKKQQQEREQEWNRLKGVLDSAAGTATDLATLDEEAWNELPVTTQDEILSGLKAQIAALDGALDEEESSGWLMSRGFVGTKMILFLALFGFVITGGVLWVISKNWKEAIQQPHADAAVQTETKRLEEEIERLTRLQTETGVAVQTDQGAKLEGLKRELEALTKLPEVVRKALSAKVPDEGLVLRMVLYMGMLGGCLHLLASLVRYVGDRELRRSWLLYYMAVPVQGAGLALLIYLLLRVGVLAPSDNGSGGIAQANLVGIYAFAGLTGMFAKAATEKLGEVFLTLFRTAKPAGDSVKKNPKS